MSESLRERYDLRIGERDEALRQLAAERDAHAKTKAERDAARALIDEIIDRVERIEDAEELRGLSRTFRKARDLHLSGNDESAVATLRADMEEDGR